MAPLTQNPAPPSRHLPAAAANPGRRASFCFPFSRAHLPTLDAHCLVVVESVDRVVVVIGGVVGDTDHITSSRTRYQGRLAVKDEWCVSRGCGVGYIETKRNRDWDGRGTERNGRGWIARWVMVGWDGTGEGEGWRTRRGATSGARRARRAKRRRLGSLEAVVGRPRMSRAERERRRLKPRAVKSRADERHSAACNPSPSAP